MKAMHREYVRALAVGDTAKMRELDDQIGEAEFEEFHGYVSAFFALMLELRFKDGASRDAVSEFVNEMRYDYRMAEPPIKPLMIEAAVRGAAGEEHLLDEIPTKELVRAQYLVIGKVAAQSEDVQARLDHYLAEAEQLAAEWATDGR